MTNKVIIFERIRASTHTLVLTLENPVSDFCLPDELVLSIDEVWQDWDCSKNVFWFYKIPDDRQIYFKELLISILEKYA